MPNYPEVYGLITEDTYRIAQEQIKDELHAASSAPAYLNQLLHTYSEIPLDTFKEDRGEVLFQGFGGAESEAHTLSNVARFVMLSQEPALTPEADGFFRGLLLGNHFIHTASSTADPASDAKKFLTKRYFRSRPWIKVTEDPDMTMPPRHILMPAKDSTPIDPAVTADSTAFSYDPFIRQSRVADAIHSWLHKYDKPVVPERYEVVASKMAAELSKTMPDGYDLYFKMGYRFMVKMYSDPDEFHRTVDLWDEWDGFSNIPDSSIKAAQIEELAEAYGTSPETEFEPLTATRSRIINELRRLLAQSGDIDATSIETYRAGLAQKLTEFVTKEKLLEKGDLLQIYGRFFAEFTSVGSENDVVTGKMVEDPDSEILGTFDGMDVIEAPSNASFKKYIKDNDRDHLVPEQLVPAFRIIEPQFFTFNKNGTRNRITPDRQFSYKLPITYTSTDIGRYIFASPEE